MCTAFRPKDPPAKRRSPKVSAVLRQTPRLLLHNRRKVHEILKGLIEIPPPPPFRSERASVHLAEHVQFPPKSQRIPEQPAEHAPRGFPASPLALSAFSTLPDSSKHSWKRASAPFSRRYARQQIGPPGAKRIAPILPSPSLCCRAGKAKRRALLSSWRSYESGTLTQTRLLPSAQAGVRFHPPCREFPAPEASNRRRLS